MHAFVSKLAYHIMLWHIMIPEDDKQRVSEDYVAETTPIYMADQVFACIALQCYYFAALCV